ncbi:MAG TPA: hypothetical protein VLN26_18625 [Gaiellaceae bacterium]|nr:hypothetical protein [Gaiellaceae bacterium]
MTFAGLMLGFAGTFTVIDGIVALAKSKFYVADAVYVFGDVRTWGWIMLIVGTIELVAAFAVFSGSQLARWFGVAVAGLNGIAQLMFLPAYPWWAISVFAVDVLVIYALVAYGGRNYSTV